MNRRPAAKKKPIGGARKRGGAPATGGAPETPPARKRGGAPPEPASETATHESSASPDRPRPPSAAEPTPGVAATTSFVLELVRCGRSTLAATSANLVGEPVSSSGVTGRARR